MKIGCVLMAAGNASRFGGNKLLCEFQGKALIEHTLETLTALPFDRMAVVTQYEEVARRAKERGVPVVINPDPSAGASLTVKLGTEQMQGMDGILFAVSDQPLLKKETVERLIADFLAEPTHIVALAHGDRRGNPVIFPAAFSEELCSLSGDVGGSAVIRAHKDALKLCFVTDARELMDVDRAEDLIRIEKGE